MTLRHKKTILDNGLRVITCRMPHARSVSVCLFIGAGSRCEKPSQAGVSHFLEHLCFKGTERRPTPRDISETIDGVGGVLNGVTDKELTVYWAKVVRPHFDLAVDLLSDMVRHSRLDRAEIENERKVIVEELNMCMDSPQSRVDILIDEVMWPDQALGRHVVGSKESVVGIDRETMVAYLSERYVPGSAVLSIAGDIGHDEAVDVVARALGTWSGDEPDLGPPAENSQGSPRLATVSRKTEQTHICVAVRGLPHLHPDRFTLDLLNVILGEGMSSRLFLEIRERRGLAYDIHSHASYYRDTGSVCVCAGVDQKNVRAVVESILQEFARLKDEVVPEEELIKARELSKGHLMLRMEDTRNVASWAGGQELLTERIRRIEDIVSIIEGISVEDIRRVSRDLFDTNKVNLALVGPIRNGGRLERLLKL